MEECKKRRLHSEDSTISTSQMADIVQNQEKMILYLFEIGRICESTFTLLQTKIESMDEKLKAMEAKNQHMESLLTKIHHSFLKEIHQKDAEIASLKELNQNMIADYESKIEYTSTSDHPEETFSFYS
jgi:hypothetical protein